MNRDPSRLPAALEAAVQKVARATGLPLHLREEVARELRDHFRRFGDPAQAARAIRAARTTGPGARRGQSERRWRRLEPSRGCR